MVIEIAFDKATDAAWHCHQPVDRTDQCKTLAKGETPSEIRANCLADVPDYGVERPSAHRTCRTATESGRQNMWMSLPIGRGALPAWQQFPT